MKIKCNRAALHEAVQLASSIVLMRTPKPILQCARIDADQDNQSLTVMATDNDITITYVIKQVQIESAGCTVIPADRIAGILHESKDDTVELRVENATCHVLGKNSRFRIYGHDPDDFPILNTPETEDILHIRADTLRRMIHMSSFAATRESSQYAINGVLWEQHGKKLRMVATDGRRLAQIDGPLASTNAIEWENVIVPVKVMNVMEKILHDPDEKVKISFAPNQISISTVAVQITANLVQGRFPKYSDVIPTGCDKKVTFNTDSFNSAVKLVSLLTNEQSKGILLSFSSGQLCLSSSAPEAGDAEIDMPVEFDGPEFNIGFNPQYVLDMLRVVEETEIKGEFTDNTKPGLIRVGKNFLYVLMPVTV